MAQLSATQIIEAPVTRVWEVLADMTSLERWGPGVKRCYLLTEQGAGVGAVRFIDRGGKNYLKEQVTAWEPYRELSCRIIETNFPLLAAYIRTRFEAVGAATLVTIDISYTLNYGAFGRLLDAIFIRRVYMRGIEAMLGELRRYIEVTPAVAA
jgi:uncharacterized protein YndB with AHSA1/START domain